MAENEKVFGKPTEGSWGNPEEDWNPTLSKEVDWSKIIRPEPMDAPDDFDLESALIGKQHSKTVQSWIENYNIKKIVDLGSGKVYVRDPNGIFTIVTVIDSFTDL
jgi:hypothetical protein